MYSKESLMNGMWGNINSENVSFVNSCSSKLPAISQKGSNPDQFIPDGWKIVKKVEGDLNMDNRNDIACVIQKTDKKYISSVDGMLLTQFPVFCLSFLKKLTAHILSFYKAIHSLYGIPIV